MQKIGQQQMKEAAQALKAAAQSQSPTGREQALAEAQEKREVRQGHPEAQAWALMGIAHFLGLRYAIWDRSAPPEAVLETTFELLTAGLAGEREAGA